MTCYNVCSNIVAVVKVWNFCFLFSAAASAKRANRITTQKIHILLSNIWHLLLFGTTKKKTHTRKECQIKLRVYIYQGWKSAHKARKSSLRHVRVCVFCMKKIWIIKTQNKNQKHRQNKNERKAKFNEKCISTTAWRITHTGNKMKTVEMRTRQKKNK